MDLSFGEVFETFIKDLKELNSELLTNVENYEIYKNLEFSNIDNFFNIVKKEEKTWTKWLICRRLYKWYKKNV